MKGIRAYEVGGPDVLKYEDMPEPSPAPGEAIVAIRNIGVNYTDVSSRKGTNPPAAFPWTPGTRGFRRGHRRRRRRNRGFRWRPRGLRHAHRLVRGTAGGAGVAAGRDSR